MREKMGFIESPIDWSNHSTSVKFKEPNGRNYDFLITSLAVLGLILESNYENVKREPKYKRASLNF